MNESKLMTISRCLHNTSRQLDRDIIYIHKEDLQYSLLAQFPVVCAKNVRIPFKRRDFFQSGNVHSGKPSFFPSRNFPNAPCD